MFCFIKRLLFHCGAPFLRALYRFSARHMSRYLPNEIVNVNNPDYLLLRRSYYLPIPDAAEITEDFLQKGSEMVGVDVRAPSALAFMEGTLPAYLSEFRARFPLHPASERVEDFHLINGLFMAGDAHIYYGLIRSRLPKRIIEVGAGRSTQVALAACRQNRESAGVPTNLTAIEPFPNESLKRAAGNQELRLLERKVQAMPLDEFQSLEAGDILFIDSTHALKSGGDVQYEYCEILPRLAPGVLVHIHDICLPEPYPRVYFDQQLFWNEQFLLQAFLTYNSRFEVVWPGNYLFVKHRDRVMACFPEIQEMRKQYPSAAPSSFWIQVK